MGLYRTGIAIHVFFCEDTPLLMFLYWWGVWDWGVSVVAGLTNTFSDSKAWGAVAGRVWVVSTGPRL